MSSNDPRCRLEGSKCQNQPRLIRPPTAADSRTPTAHVSFPSTGQLFHHDVWQHFHGNYIPAFLRARSKAHLRQLFAMCSGRLIFFFARSHVTTSIASLSFSANPTNTPVSWLVSRVVCRRPVAFRPPSTKSQAVGPCYRSSTAPWRWERSGTSVTTPSSQVSGGASVRCYWRWSSWCGCCHLPRSALR